MFIIEKCEEDQDNLSSTFKLVDTDSDGSAVFFNRSNFREVLSAVGFSPQRVGCVLRILNSKYPIEHVNIRRGGVSAFGDSVLIDFLRQHGYSVCRNLAVNAKEVVLELERRGYCVRRKLNLSVGDPFEFSIN